VCQTRMFEGNEDLPCPMILYVTVQCMKRGTFHPLTMSRDCEILDHEGDDKLTSQDHRMAKRKSDAGEEGSKDKKPPSPKRRPIIVTLESDPAISTDHAKIDGLLSQGKSWRSVPLSLCGIDFREIANYYPDHNADTIKKRYQLCNRVLMETFSDDDVSSINKGNDFRIPS
jgi:hypothetical protein